MKKYLKLFILIFSMILGAFFVNYKYVSAIEINENVNDLSSFLSFEKAITKLNNSTYFENYATQNLLSNNGENSELQENNKFILKRLIVQGNIKSTYGATDVISYNDLHILCYNSQKKIEYAYDMLSTDPSLNVLVDEIKSLEKYAEQDYNYTSYKNWGAESIQIGGYRQYLIDNNVNKEIVVVVLDTGINTSHDMFTNRLLTDNNGKIKGFSYYNSSYQYSYNNLAFDVDDKSTLIDESDNNKYSFEDDFGHGTHVSGIICSLTPENVKILPIKISDNSGYSSTSIFIAAYLRIINIYSKQYNIVSTNLSYSGGGKSSETEKNTFNEKCYEPLLDLKILPITAAGNENQENNVEGLKAVVVSALKKYDNQYIFDKSYSNYGKIIDISAPGSLILSAGIASSDKKNSSLVYMSGTSMASPQVAGVVALLYLNPNLPSNFTALDIEQQLYDNSLDMGETNKDIYYGEGILNLRYFEVDNTATLSFYKNGTLIKEHIENENFENEFTLEIKPSSSEFKVIYTIDKSIPNFNNHITYNNSINVNNSIIIYAMGVKIVNNEIIERTNLYNISYFYSSTSIEDCFTIDSRGYLTNYTGNFTKLNIPSVIKGQTVYGLGPSLFKDSNVEYVTLPDTVTTISGYAFQNAKKLKFIYAPNVTKIYIAAFNDCDSLKFVSDIHPESNKTEGAYFPNLTETIGFSFSGCDNLEKVSLSKLKTLGEEGYDFQNCPKLESVHLPLITSIPKGTFYLSTSLGGEFQIGEYIQIINSNAFMRTNIKSFVINKNNKYFYTDELALYSTSSLVTYASANKDLDYEILSSVSINGVNYNINAIEEGAMTNTSFNNLIIPSTITSINGLAFYETTINNLYYNAENISYSGYWDEDTYMRKPVFHKINVIIIGESVKVIPKRLFQDVYFDELIINSVSTIFESSSFYRMKEQGDLNKLIFNFNDKIDSKYLDMVLQETHLIVHNSINYIYLKNEIPQEYQSNSLFKYKMNEGDFIVYSKNSLIEQYTITSSSNDLGMISPKGDILLDEGSSQTFIITPNTGYYVESILIDNVKLSDDALYDAINNGYTFTNINSNHTIHVVFAVKTYTITYKESNGNIILGLTPTSYTYGVGATLPTTVNKEGNYFEGWYSNSNLSGEMITEVSSKDIGDKIYYAKFSAKTYSITIIQAEHGIINGEKNVYSHGENASFMLIPDIGYHISHLLVDGNIYVFSSNEYVFTSISKNHTISAIFKPNTDTRYTVRHWQQSLTEENSILIGSNYYTLISIDTSKKGITNTQTEVSSYKFTGFTAQPIIQKNILGDESTIVDILYDRNTYSLNLIKGKGIEDVIGNGNYLYGENVKLNASMIEGYNWVSWVSSNTNFKGSTNIQYTFKMPDSDVELTATAAIKQFIITIISNGNGNIKPSTNQTINYGENLELEIEANLGYKLTSLLLDGIDMISFVEGNKYKLENIVESHIVEAEFNLMNYTILASASNNGNIEPCGNVKINYGESKLFKIIPNEGYEAISIKVDGVMLENNILLEAINEGYTFNSVKENHEIVVIFAKKENTIFASFEGEGKLNLSGEVNVKRGDNKLFNFEASEGSLIDDVLIDGESVGALSEYEFKNVKENHEIKVIFKKKIYKVEIDIFGKGNFTSESNLENIEHGTNVYINLIADKGYEVYQIWIDKNLVGAKDNILEILDVKSNLKVTIMFEETKENSGEVSSIGGLSCSKQKEENGNIFDFLFVLLTIVAIAIPKKRIFK